MSRLVSAEEARGLLEGVDPEGWLVEVLPPPSTRPANAAELLADLQRPAAYLLDQGGSGTVAEVVALSDAPLLAAAPDLAATVIALSEERDRLCAILACERGEAAPEGWEWEWSTRRWLRARPWNAQVGGRFRGGYGYRLGLDDAVGGFTSMLEAIEAADRAAGEVKP